MERCSGSADRLLSSCMQAFIAESLISVEDSTVAFYKSNPSSTVETGQNSEGSLLSNRKEIDDADISSGLSRVRQQRAVDEVLCSSGLRAIFGRCELPFIHHT